MRSITAIVAVAAFVLSACGGQSDGDLSQQTESGDKQWGPLAVFPPAQGHAQARTPGTLHVTHECIVLEQQGKTVLLAWPADRTAWDPETRTVTFQNLNGKTVTVGSRDEVVLGGGGSHVDEDGITNQEYISRREWLSPPEPSCVTDQRFSVSSVEHGSDQQP